MPNHLMGGACALALALTGMLCVASEADAQIPAQVDWAGYTWEVDRADPNEFEPDISFQGRDDVLRVLIQQDDGVNDFFDWKGRKTTAGLPAGPTFATVDLFIPQTWAGQKPADEDWQMTGLWGFTGDSVGPTAFPIIVFSNSELDNGDAGNAVASGGRIQVWNVDAPSTGGWTVVNDPVNFGAWNTLRFEFDEGQYRYYLNGKLVNTQDLPFSVSENALDELFINSQANSVAEYEAFYSMLLAGLLEDPQTFEIAGSVSAMSNVYHFNSVGDFVSRRGLSATDDFSLGKNVWVNTGGIRGEFDLSSGSSFDGEAYFARFGMDVIQPADGMRIGVTGSVGRAETDMSTARGKADAESDNYSIGGYLTYVAPSFYLDILSEISWGDWDIRVPEESEQSTDATTFLVSAEAGAAIWRGDGFSLVPNAQLVYLNTDFDDVAFGYVDVSYEDSDAFIGRFGARFQYDVPDGVEGSRVYVGASVVSELAGDSETIIDSPTFSGGNTHAVSGGFDDVAAQFAAGVDLSLGDSARLHGDASYLVGDDAEAFRGVGGLTFKW